MAILCSAEWQFYVAQNRNSIPNVEDGTGRLSRNVGTELPVHAA